MNSAFFILVPRSSPSRPLAHRLDFQPVAADRELDTARPFLSDHRIVGLVCR